MNKSTYFNNSISTLALCCVSNAAQGFFRFWRFWASHTIPCPQGAPLHFTESGNNQPNRKRSHKAAHRLHDTVKRGMVQSIRANSRYFTNPATLEFFFPNSSLFRPKIHAKPSWQWQLGLNFNPSILIVGGREYLPPFLADRMDLYAI